MEDIYRHSQRPKYDCLLFGKWGRPEARPGIYWTDIERNLLITYPSADLDDTLYPLSLGIAKECRKNIGGFFLSPSLLLSVVIWMWVNISKFRIIKQNGAPFTDYLVEELRIDPSKVDALCNLLYKNYGTTMAGLRVSSFFLISRWILLFLFPPFGRRKHSVWLVFRPSGMISITTSTTALCMGDFRTRI